MDRSRMGCLKAQVFAPGPFAEGWSCQTGLEGLYSHLLMPVY